MSTAWDDLSKRMPPPADAFEIQWIDIRRMLVDLCERNQEDYILAIEAFMRGVAFASTPSSPASVARAHRAALKEILRACHDQKTSSIGTRAYIEYTARTALDEGKA